MDGAAETNRGMEPSHPHTKSQPVEEKEVVFTNPIFRKWLPSPAQPVRSLGGRISPGGTPEQRLDRAADQLVRLAHAQELRLFLDKSEARRAEALQDRARAQTIQAAVRRADQQAVVNSAKQHTLLLELVASSQESVRRLAYLCLEAGADPKVTNLVAATPLHYAVKHNDVALTQQLLAAGLSAGDKTVTGRTPIHFAIEGGNPAIIETLLDSGDTLPFITDKLVWPKLLRQLDPNREKTTTLVQKVLPRIPSDDLKLLLTEGSKESKLIEQVVMEMVLRAEAIDLNDLNDRALIERALEGVLSRSFENERDVKFMQTVLAMPYAGLLDVRLNGDQDAVSLLGALTRHPNLPAEIRNTCQGLSDAEIIEALDKKAQLMEVYKKADCSWLALSLLVEGMRKPLKALAANPKSAYCLPLHTTFKKELIPLYNKTKARLEAFVQRAEQNLALLDDPASFLGEDAAHFDGYLVYSGRADLFAHRWKDHIEPDDILSSLLLDKMGQEGESEGSPPVDAAAALSNVLEKLLAGSWKEAAIEGIQSKLAGMTLPLIQQCALISMSDAVDSAEFYSQRIGVRVSKLRIGEKILLPTGSATHATLLLLEKTSDKTARLIHYNTGEGIDSKHRLEGTNKYQTHVVIKDVPLEDLVGEGVWRRLLRLFRTEESMTAVNAFIFEELGKHGTRLPPSKSREDHEDNQREGTCSFQSLMAFLRHQIMEMTPGTKQEKLAAYKLIKAKMLLPYAKRRLQLVGSDNRATLKTPIAKLEGEVKLSEIAHSDAAYRIASEKFGQFLKTVEENGLADRLASAQRPLQRYALLREASVIKANYWIQRQNAPRVPMPNESLAKARYEHRLEMERRHRKLFSGLQTPIERHTFLIRLVTESSIPSLGFTLATQCLDLTNEEDKAGLKAMVEELRVHHPDHVASLAQAYRNEGLNEVAPF